MPREEDSHITCATPARASVNVAKNLLTGFEFCGNQADFVDARARMMSIARATSMNITSLSALTKAIFRRAP